MLGNLRLGAAIVASPSLWHCEQARRHSMRSCTPCSTSRCARSTTNPIHEQPAYRYLGLSPMVLRATHALCQRILSLPMFPGITRQKWGRVTQVLGRAVSDLCAALALAQRTAKKASFPAADSACCPVSPAGVASSEVRNSMIPHFDRGGRTVGRTLSLLHPVS
jgi:hypothetical protein